MLVFNALCYFPGKANIFHAVSSLIFYSRPLLFSLFTGETGTPQTNTWKCLSCSHWRLGLNFVAQRRKFLLLLLLFPLFFYSLIFFFFFFAVLWGPFRPGLFRARICDHGKLENWGRSSTLFKLNVWGQNAISSDATECGIPSLFAFQRA